jgi:hypothetical protein
MGNLDDDSLEACLCHLQSDILCGRPDKMFHVENTSRRLFPLSKHHQVLDSLGCAHRSNPDDVEVFDHVPRIEVWLVAQICEIFHHHVGQCDQ